MGVSEGFKWVTVASFDLEQEAAVCMAYLETEGLKVGLKNELIARSYPSVSAATGGVQVMVPDKEVVRASVLLEKAGYLVPATSPGINEKLIGSLPKVALILILLFSLILFAIYYFS